MTDLSPPRSVMIAVYLMYAGAALSIVRGLLGLLLDLPAIKSRLSESLGAEAESAMEWGAAGATVVSLATAGLWVWMAVMNVKGRPWARVMATVLFGFASLSTLGAVFEVAIGGPQPISNALMTLLLWLVGLLAVIALWTSNSSLYFSEYTWPP